MDEPFAALDAITREEMAVELHRVWEADRKTVVFVTHSVPEAVLLSERIVVMSPRPGRIADIVDVPLPRPRNLDMQYSEQFGAIARHVRDQIGVGPSRQASGALS
jgi:NitT/TauT family transport system ATP-binding protein